MLYCGKSIHIAANCPNADTNKRHDSNFTLDISDMMDELRTHLFDTVAAADIWSEIETGLMTVKMLVIHVYSRMENPLTKPKRLL